MQLPAATDVAAAMPPTGLLSTQLAVAYATSTTLKWLKYQKWFPLMAKEAALLNRLFSVLIAFIAAIGIHWSFDAAAGVMTITGLTFAGIASALWAWFTQFAMQQGVFKVIVQPEERRQQEEGSLERTSLTTGTGDGTTKKQ